jgi:hypothetical protein
MADESINTEYGIDNEAGIRQAPLVFGIRMALISLVLGAF